MSTAVELISRELEGLVIVPDDSWSSLEDLNGYEIVPKGVYSDAFVTRVVKLLTGREVPPDPYNPDKFDWDALKNEACLAGFSKLEDALTDVERVCTFQTLLRNDSKKEQKSFNDWTTASMRFWRKVSRSSETRIPDPRFKSWVDLERKINYGTPGWVLESSDGFGVRYCGPALKIDFKGLRRGGSKHRVPDVPSTVKMLLDRSEISDSVETNQAG
jgi:hypothetical protein